MEFFKHDINASCDDKICDLLSSGGYEMLGYYWRFIEYLYGRCGRVAKNKINGVAWSLHMDAEKLLSLIYDFDLFVDDGEYIFSVRVLNEVQEFEEKGKILAEAGRKGGKASAKSRLSSHAEATLEATLEARLEATVDDLPSDPQAEAQQKKIKENKIKEKKRDKKIEERFSVFWDSYPRKEGKGAAYDVFSRINPDDDLLNEMLFALERVKKSDQWEKEGGRFIPHPRTWLHQKRWEDEPRIKENDQTEIKPVVSSVV